MNLVGFWGEEETRCSVWGRGTAASQGRVLWPEGVGDLSVQEARRPREMALQVGGAPAVSSKIAPA